MQNKVQGKYGLELKFVDETRLYLNYWDSFQGQDVCCQIKDGKLYKFGYSPKEVEEDEPKIDDEFKQEEISLQQFVELVQDSILQAEI